MNTLYLTANREGVIVDSKTGVPTLLTSKCSDINYIYIAPDDCLVSYTDRDRKTTTKPAKKGDIIITLYTSSDFSQRLIIIKNEDFKNKFIEEAVSREKRACESKLQNKCHESCDDCNSYC